MLQTSLPYKITLPDESSQVVGPDSSEPGFLAHLTRITSDVSWETSDSPIAAGDGALLGSMYRGARSVVLDLLITDHDQLARAEKIEWLQRINGVLRDTNGITLSWTEATGWEKEITGLRPSGYISVGDGWPKELQVVLKTANPFILSSEVHSRELADESGTLELFNGGNAPAYPKFFVYGPFDDFLITNYSTGEELLFTEQVDDGDYIEIDTRRRTVLLNGSANAYGAIDYSSSSFFSLAPLSAELPVIFATTGGAANTKLITRWQSAWE